MDKGDIELFGDGAHCAEAGFGTWAFRAPALGLEGVGTDSGQGSGRFEALAILHGLEAVAAAGVENRAVRAFSDSEEVVAFVAAVIQAQRSGRSLSDSAKCAKAKADLISRFHEAYRRLPFAIQKYVSGSLDHQWCHRAASRRLRASLRNDPLAQHCIAIERERAKLAKWIDEREGLVKRLCALDDAIAMSQLHLDALEAAAARLSAGEPGERITLLESDTTIELRQ